VAPIPETEIPQAEGLPSEALESEQPKPTEEVTPTGVTGALEWKPEELPAWLKEITEAAPTQEVPAAMEAPAVEETPVAVEAPALEETPVTMEAAAIEEIPPAPLEPMTEWTKEEAPSLEVSEGKQEETQPEIPSWVREVSLGTEVEPINAVEEVTAKEVTPAAAIPPELPLEPAEVVPEVDLAALSEAKNAIEQGNPAQANEIYSGLIKQNAHLDEIIKDLQKALYRFPVDINMWITLGDAYFRTDELQEALNAYTKAEELVR
jgi:tetratricopeptide (TPR) repeat protein